MSKDSRLVSVISARKRLRWKEYCEAVDVLSVDTSEPLNRPLLRTLVLQCLQSLGYCDAYYDRGSLMISAVPATLCRLPIAGLPTAVLTGTRSTNTIDDVRKILISKRGSIQMKTQSFSGFHNLIPDAIILEAESTQELNELALTLNIRYVDVPAWTIAKWCGSISEYEATLQYNIPETLNWKRLDYNLDNGQFSQDSISPDNRLSRYINPTTGLPIHVLFRGGAGAEVDLNWARYLFFNINGHQVIDHDVDKSSISIPARVPVPPIIARAFCLSSGMAPQLKLNSKEKNVPYSERLVFENVPPSILSLMVTKLGQTSKKLALI